MSYYQDQTQGSHHPPAQNGPPPPYASQAQYAPPPGPPPAHLQNTYKQHHYQQPQHPYQQPQYQNQQQYQAFQHHQHHQQYQYQQPNQQLQPYQQPHYQSDNKTQHQHQHQQQFQHQHQQHQEKPAAQLYRLRAGFPGLPTRFVVWNNVPRSSTGYLCLSTQVKGEILFSAKVSSGSKTKVRAGAEHNESAPVIVEARSKHAFSTKNIVYFEGYETILDGGAGSHSGAKWPIDLPINGRDQQWEWRRVKNPEVSLMSKLLKGSSLGNWELCPAGSPQGSRGIASWTSGSGISHATSGGAELGTFQFNGPAAMGQLGDRVMVLAVTSMLRILHLYIIEKVAAAIGSAG